MGGGGSGGAGGGRGKSSASVNPNPHWVWPSGVERTMHRQRERVKVPKDTNPINTLVSSILYFEQKSYVSWLSSIACSPCSRL